MFDWRTGREGYHDSTHFTQNRRHPERPVASTVQDNHWPESRDNA